MGTMKSKVIFCGNSLSGMLSFRFEVMNEFKKNGWEVCIVSPKNTASDKIIERLNKIGKIYLLDVESNTMNPIEDIGYFFKLHNIYRQLQPKLVFHYTIKPNIYGTLAANMLSIPSVAMVAGLGYIFEGGGVLKNLARQLYKLGLRRANKVIALNLSNANALIAGKYVDHKKLIHFKGGEGVDLSKYPNYEDQKFNQPKFLMIARLLYDKGYKEFIEAAKIVKQKYPDIEFELLGPIDKTSPMRVPEAVIQSDCKSIG